MKLSENFKKDELYEHLCKSLNETFLGKSLIPEKERFCFCINMDGEAVRKKFDAHKARCRKKYRTDEGVSLFNINFFPKKNKNFFEIAI